LFASFAANAAEFRPAEVHPRISGQTLEFTGGFDLALTPKVEEALGKGIPLETVLEVRLYRERSLLWNARVASWKHRREIRYHALSGQYLVQRRDGGSGTQESFTSLPEALRHLGSLDELRLTLEDPPAAGDSYLVRARTALDIEALPALLRPVAYTSMSWHLDSGWSVWKVAR
jgi:hypothetical protein